MYRDGNLVYMLRNVDRIMKNAELPQIRDRGELPDVLGGRNEARSMIVLMSCCIKKTFWFCLRAEWCNRDFISILGPLSEPS